MKCKIMQFMMMMMEVEEDRRKRYEADKGRRRKMRRESGREGRWQTGSGKEEDIADSSSAIVGPDSISSRETRTDRCAPCSEHAWGKRRFLQKMYVSSEGVNKPERVADHSYNEYRVLLALLSIFACGRRCSDAGHI
jgi:hypothetical protein